MAGRRSRGADGAGAGAERFAADLARVAGDGGTLALAVSGGPDSMALLILAAAARPGRIVVATVDHQLRAESADEAAMVSDECAKLGIPHTILAPESPIAGASVQAQAREVRYALLAHWAQAQGASAIATAHHADDQAETFLMRAARGSGLSGLAGIRARVEIEGVPVVRPLLEWRRAELRAIVRRAGSPFVDDPANHDPRHDRTRFRQLLEHHEWLGVPQLAASAAQLAEVDADVRATAAWLWGERATASEGSVALDVRGLPPELRRRLVRRAVTAVRETNAITDPAWSEAGGVEPLLEALSAGSSATRAGVKATAREAIIGAFDPLRRGDRAERSIRPDCARVFHCH